MNKFEKDKYMIVRGVIDPQLATFVHDYFLLKRQVAQTFFNSKYISPFTTEHGTLGDSQCPDSYSHYGDVAMETLLIWIKPVMEKKVKHKLYPTYSYARVYDKGATLNRHIDRYSCEISTTLNLGGDVWPIYLENTKGKKIKVILNQGDMLVYKGSDLYHWREPLEKNYCVQVFLHYNKEGTKKSKENYLDGRVHLGLPKNFIKENK
jgi:hypothetical protein|tara:strand:+ start:2955 stop:3575 length:621 start_codon:yes stop_codon:yes gene_type:complete